MITEPIFTPHLCETMYAHYDEQIQLYKNDPPRRKFLEEAQQCYIEMHSMLHNIHLYLEELGF